MRNPLSARRRVAPWLLQPALQARAHDGGAVAGYFDNLGDIRPERVFDHVVELTRELNLYCRLEDSDGVPASHARLRDRAGEGMQWGGNSRYSDDGHYSLLSMEQIVKPTLLAIPGIQRVSHRAKAREHEVRRIGRRDA